MFLMGALKRCDRGVRSGFISSIKKFQYTGLASGKNGKR